MATHDDTRSLGNRYQAPPGYRNRSQSFSPSRRFRSTSPENSRERQRTEETSSRGYRGRSRSEGTRNGEWSRVEETIRRGSGQGSHGEDSSGYRRTDYRGRSRLAARSRSPLDFGRYLDRRSKSPLDFGRHLDLRSRSPNFAGRAPNAYSEYSQAQSSRRQASPRNDSPYHNNTPTRHETRLQFTDHYSPPRIDTSRPFMEGFVPRRYEYEGISPDRSSSRSLQRPGNYRERSQSRPGNRRSYRNRGVIPARDAPIHVEQNRLRMTSPIDGYQNEPHQRELPALLPAFHDIFPLASVASRAVVPRTISPWRLQLDRQSPYAPPYARPYTAREYEAYINANLNNRSPDLNRRGIPFPTELPSSVTLQEPSPSQLVDKPCAICLEEFGNGEKGCKDPKICISTECACRCIVGETCLKKWFKPEEPIRSCLLCRKKLDVEFPLEWEDFL